MKLTRRSHLSLSIILLSLITAYGQSGRRSTGSSTSTTAPSVSGPKKIEKIPPASKLQFLVGINRDEPFANVPFYLYDTVLDNCIRRLGESETVFAASAGNKMDRADAIKAARHETARYVVSLEVGSEYADAGKEVKKGTDELYVKYIIFEPETGKIKQSGRTQQRIYQTGKGGVSSPSKNGAVYSEYAVKQAAREAADRILGAFDIKVREDWPD